MAGEPGGTHLLSELSAVAADLLLPVLQPDLDLDWARHEPDDPLYAGRPGGTLGEPVGQRLGPDAIRLATIILVPALGVDRAGFRLGRGGGSYDRALARVPAETPVIALLYADERYDALPTDSHDRRVTAVVTPAGLQSCGW
jgi:5-formyltetrahydrofolate cyclo-ligase